MPNIGLVEILVVVVVAIIVIGPKDFPFMLKKIGSWIGTIKRYVGDIQREASILDNENFDVDIDKENLSELKNTKVTTNDKK